MTVDIFDWRQHLKVHPAADLFPLMSEPELRELAENIKKNGLQQPILIWRQHGVGSSFQDYLLDGRNRLDALAMLGWLAPQRGRLHRERQDDFKRLLPLIVDYPEDSFSDHIRPYDSVSPEWRGFELHSGLCEEDDAYRLVLSLNIHRRHLTAAQKRDLITRALKRDPAISDRRIGETVKADHKTVGAVRAELESTGEIPRLEKTVGADGKARKQQTRKPKQNPSLDETRVDNDRAWEIAQPIRPPDPDPQPLFDPTDATAEREAAEVSAEKRKAQYAAAEREQTPAELLANSGDYRGGDQIAVFVLADQIHKLFPTMSESARAGVVRFATEIAAQYADVEAAA